MSSKWVKLTEMLIRQTKNGKLDWNETSDDDVFQTVVGSNVIELECDMFSEVYLFRIRNSRGKLVDSFTDKDLTAIIDEPFHGELEKLMQLIRRRIAGAEQVLDDVLKQLEENEEILF